jgi:hypothetical protein
MRHSEVFVVKISGSGLLYFKKYRVWKLRFLTSSETSFKHVFLVKQSYLKLAKSKLSATSSIGKMIDHSISVPNFISRFENLDMWQTVQVCSSVRYKTTSFGKLQ